ncbi:MAG: transporter [Gammaproteobacteria bacterium]|nr:transporter [Gammaproteobacteria bacterium]
MRKTVFLGRGLMFCMVISGLGLITNHALAGCGSSNCFLTTGTQEGVFAPGQVVLDLSYRYLSQDKKLRGHSNTNEVLVPKVDFENEELELAHHRERRTLNTLAQLDINVGLTERLTLAIALPFLNDRRHEHDDGVDLGAGENGIFTNNDGSSGFGDVSITGKYAFLITIRHLFVGGLGVKLPTGEYKLLNGEGNINEPTVMPGTGSYDFLLSGHYSYQWQPRQLDSFIALQYRLNTKNKLDYQFGNATVLNVGVNYRTSEKVVVMGQLNTRVVERDEFRGQGVPSSGNTMIYLSPGIRIQSSDDTAFYVHLQLPVYQDVNEVNIVPNYGLQFGLSHSL